MNGFEVLRRALDADTAVAGDIAVCAPRCASLSPGRSDAGRVPHPPAKWADDPWSEHIALPGGARTGNETPAETVRREVREEVGISIGDTEEPTALPQLWIRLAGRERTLLLDSFVYHVTGPIPALRCSPEIHYAFWVPVTDLWNPVNLDHLCSVIKGILWSTPPFVYPGKVFGITLLVLTLLSIDWGCPPLS